MLIGEELVIQTTNDGRGYVFFTRKRDNISPQSGLKGGVNFTKYTSAATLATAVQAEMPTLTT